VRFETYPYEPKKDIKHLEGYDEFLRRKDEFAQRLFEKTKQFNLNAKKKRYDLLVLSVPIEANSLQQSVERYASLVKQLEGLIDEVVEELGVFDNID